LKKKGAKKPSSGSSNSGGGGDVNQLFVSQLTEMGFSREHAIRALNNTGGKNLESAMDWCLNHPDDSNSGQKLGGDSSKPPQQQPTPVQQQPAAQPTNTNTDSNSQQPTTTNTNSAPTDNMQVDQPATTEKKTAERKLFKSN